MLAQSFLSAEELGLSENLHQALIQVLGMLDRGEIADKLFDMRTVGGPECGTPGCIYGWCKTVYKETPPLIITIDSFPSFPAASDEQYNFHQLVAPIRVGKYNPYEANRGEAAIALRGYLTTGKTNWDEAMATK